MVSFTSMLIMLVVVVEVGALDDTQLSQTGFLKATADFSQANLDGVQAHGVDGHLLDNRNFIFLWKNGGYFKMVLTMNNGTTIKAGYLNDPGTTWKNPNTWIDNKGFYSILNFKGVEECEPGYECECLDINECSNDNGGCNQKCINTPGSFHCNCNSGYNLGHDKKTCQDINECSNNNGGCNQKCVNTPGSFHCNCKSGYKLKDDKKTCVLLKTYIFVDAEKSWVDAEHYCEERNAHLVSITSLDDNQGLTEQAHQKGIRNIWIGLTDEKDEDVWLWTEPTSSKSSYRNWSSGQPDGGWDENCAAMSIEYGKWFDVDCSDTYTFACFKGVMRCNGQDSGCCTKDNPCDDGDGKCHSDSECSGSLICGYENCPWGDGDDCCMNPDMKGDKVVPSKLRKGRFTKKAEGKGN